MKEPKIDERTREFLRKWGRREVPTAQVTGGEVTPGTYRAMPFLAWMERRGPVALCGMHFILVHNQAWTPFGALSMAMPVSKNTELHINSFLHLVGWDGRVWPYDGDGGFPEDSPDDAAQLKEMLRKVKIRSTLTFPPTGGPGGARVLTVNVLKRSSPFPFAPFEPLPEGSDPPVVHLERFRELCKDPSPFALPN
jgi:hypothetical protein